VYRILTHLTNYSSFHEENKIVDHLGEQLLAAGYHFYGSEPLYSGLSGELMHCDIFMGLVYYQRLRHMVRFLIHSPYCPYCPVLTIFIVFISFFPQH